MSYEPRTVMLMSVGNSILTRVIL